MKRFVCMIALMLTVVLLAACGPKNISTEEATALALEKIYSDASHQFSEIWEDQITCEYEERDDGGYYRVTVPFECSCCSWYKRTFHVLIKADTGTVERLMMSK